tara:strand:+ start:981 stop:1184 length:204 start_codon:yes stop_codon:yes gene_type:complete
LAYYANKVDINVELSAMEIQLLNDLIIYKKDELSEIEKSWLWKWYKSNTEAERDMIIKMFYLGKRKK